MTGRMRRGRARGGELIVLLGMLVAVSPFAIDSYTPSLPTIAQDLGVASGTVALTISTFFLGLACGGLFWGPLSDRFGRRPILFSGLAVFVAASIACALIADVPTLIAIRAVQGLAAAAMPAAGLAVTRDVWAGDQAARAVSFVMLVLAVAPLVAPFIGGQLLALLGWRSAFWFMAGFALLALALAWWRLPETNAPERRREARVGASFRAYGQVLGDRRAWLHLLCGGMAYGGLFAYVTGVPFVYIDLFGVDPRYFGFLIGVNVLGSMSGNWLNARFVTRYGARRLMGIGIGASLAGQVALLACAVTGAGGLAAIAAALFVGLAPVPMISANNVSGLMNLYPRNAGACSALYSVCQFGFGALAGALVSALYAGTPAAMAGVMLGCVGVSLLAYLGMRAAPAAPARA